MCSPWRILLLMGIISALVFSVCAKKKQNAKDAEDKPSTSGRKGKGLWIGGPGTGMDHGHGHGWMKLHNDKHHDHSSKLSEAYVKFHGLGEKGSNSRGGILGRVRDVINRLGIGGRGNDDEDNQGSGSGWGSNSNSNSGNNGGSGSSGGGWGGSGGGAQEILTLSLARPRPSGGGGGGGGGGWGAPPSMMQMQTGWSNPQVQMVVAQPTGWASQSGPLNQQSSNNNNNGGGSKGGNSGGNNGGNNRPVGWAAGDFQTYKPPRGSNNRNREKGHFQLNFPTGRPAYVQRLKPIIDLPKIALHGWRR